MIYLDTSAAAQLVIREPESAALRTWLAARHEPASVSSEIVVVELQRACRRVDPESLPLARQVLARLDMVPLGRGILDAAAELRHPTLRSLDAIHLASALSLGGELTAFVTYDDRLAGAAVAERLETVSPGR